MTVNEFSRRLVVTASDFVGLEETKNNAAWDDLDTAASEKAKSDLLVATMKRIDGWSPGAPYCAAFDGAAVVLTSERSGIDPQPFLDVWTAHCMSNVRRFTKLGLLVTKQPVAVSLMLMQHGDSDSGHAGISTRIDGSYPNRMLINIEGNTMPGVDGDQRQGDGIYLRGRNVWTNGKLKTRGWLPVSAILQILKVTPE
jgi:hypothetical protein